MNLKVYSIVFRGFCQQMSSCQPRKAAANHRNLDCSRHYSPACAYSANLPGKPGVDQFAYKKNRVRRFQRLDAAKKVRKEFGGRVWESQYSQNRNSVYDIAGNGYHAGLAMQAFNEEQ